MTTSANAASDAVWATARARDSASATTMQPSHAANAATWTATRSTAIDAGRPSNRCALPASMIATTAPSGGNRPLRSRGRAADGAGERPEADRGPEPERRRGVRSSSAARPRSAARRTSATGRAAPSGRGAHTGSATIISRTPAETSRHNLAVIPPERRAANGTPKPSAKPSSDSQRPSTSRMRPARAGPGRTASVGSPTLKKNAPRAGWESEPTASHSTT